MMLAILISISIVRENYIIPAVGTVVAILVLFFIRGKVTEIIADERDHEIGGKAARLTIQIFAWTAVLIMVVLFARRDLNPGFEAVAYTLAYMICFIMILYSVIFHYYDKTVFLEKKAIQIIIGVLILTAMIIFGIRLFTGEDDYICQNGQWIKHGNPSFPPPAAECKK